MPSRPLKRIVDVAGAALGLAVLAMPMAIIAVLIRLRMGPPVLYRAARAGIHGKPFVLYKFRTMTSAVDAAGAPRSDRERVTPLGRFLRRTSLDELPQIFNVLRGHLSLVGPRPLHTEYLELYTAEQARRHDVTPGITGLAQVSGRNTLSWDQRFALDVQYVENASFLLDLTILARTAARVLTRRDVSPDGDLDTPSFTGTPPRA